MVGKALDPSRFFTAEQQEEIIELLRSIEEKTTGRIMVHLERRLTITDPLSRAIKLFHQLNLQNSPDRNNILIYFATEYHLFAILGDEGFNQTVPVRFWRDLKKSMERKFKKEHFFEGTYDAITQLGITLEKTFPKRPTTQPAKAA